MGSFQHTTFEEIAKASVIAELGTQTRNQVLPFRTIGSSPETWSVAFAPDHSYFAWSCGNRVVKLVPWDREKKRLCGDLDSLVHQFNNNTTTDDREVGNSSSDDPFRKVVTISCKDLVWSLAFGWSIPQKSRRCHQSYYLHEDDDLVLAIGLKSGKIKTYNVKKGTHILLVDHKSVVRDLKFTPDGSLNLVSASYDGTLKVWDLKDDGNMVATLKGHSYPLYGCAISPDSNLLASVGEQRMVIIWDFKNYKMLRKLTGHRYHVSACEFSIDGAILATSSYDTRVILWDPYTGEVLSQFSHIFPILSPVFAGGSNSYYVRDIAFSPDGMHFATVCDDNLVRVWAIADNRDPVMVTPLQEPLCCAFTPNGSVLVAGSRSGMIQFATVPRRLQPLQQLCRMALRRAFPDWMRASSNLKVPGVLHKYVGYRDLPQEIMTDE